MMEGDYEGGGLWGGTLERPALQRLLADSYECWRCYQSNANRSPHDALKSFESGSLASLTCHSVGAAESFL